jgi:NAD(P)-dependent dehydrogenase (short-subunit alcohol dehydrogenase family)
MSSPVWNFSGERVLVTGGAGGIGLAIGEAFVRAGAHVVLLGRGGAALAKAAEVAAAAGEGEASSVACDLQDAREIVRAAHDVTDRLGGVDVLVNNAGVSMHVPLVDCPDHVINLNLDVNLRAVMLLTREFLRGMIEQGRGNVINIASQAAKRGWPENTHYSASKVGVLGFTLALAAEVAPEVRVNAVCPGMVFTGMMQNNIRVTSERKAISYDAAYEEWSSGIPMGRMQKPVDIANAVLFLASDAASEITGEALNVSGGQTTH